MKYLNIFAYAVTALIVAAMIAYWVYGKPSCPPGAQAELDGRGAWHCFVEPLP